jgi:hypothetical protein
MDRARLFASIAALVPVTAALFLWQTPVVGQGKAAPPKAAARSWTPPRTSWGDPDLQGAWQNFANTPLERLSDERHAAFLKQLREEAERAEKNERGGLAYYEKGTPSDRTSMIIDPPDGKIPPLSPEGQRRAAARAEANRNRKGIYDVERGWRAADTWEDRDLWERCITRGVPNSMIPHSFSNNYNILQTKDFVAIQYEIIHDVRIIPLDGRPHIGRDIRQWMGDSRGRFEGNTLVVDVTNFHPMIEHLREAGLPITSYRGAGANLHVVERFTRVDADTIDYQFTIEDPTTFSRPWTASIPLVKRDEVRDQMHEFACHEGNYWGMIGILGGARAEEAEEAAAAAQKK